MFQTTLTQWAFLYDCLLVASFYFTLSEAGYAAVQDESAGAGRWQRNVLWALFLGHWLFSKTIKLVPHLLRNPGDVRFVAVSVLFGYFHNLIKLYGCITVTEVRSPAPAHASRLLTRCRQTTWGTREGADADDNIRMIPIPPMAAITPPLTPPPQGRMLRERGALMPAGVS